jgi:PAS domain S-box-containing protein
LIPAVIDNSIKERPDFERPMMHQEPVILPPLRILLLEDDSADAELILEQLSKERLNAQVKRVQTGPDFTEALDSRQFDLILADCKLYSFSGFAALEQVKSKAPDIPFIFVSGTLGEEVAVESLKKGATDYILKHQLIRLGPAIRRALREVKERQAREQALQALRRNEQDLSDFFEHAPVGFHCTGPDGRILKVNQAELNMFGYKLEDYLGHHFSEFHVNKQAAEMKFARLLKGESIIDLEALIVCKDDSIKSVLITSNGLWEHGKFVHSRTFTRDITSHRRAEMQTAAFSKLGRHLSSASTQAEAAHNIAAIADELFGWDAFVLDLYFSEDDTVQTLLRVNTRNGRKIEAAPDASGTRPPTPITRRVISAGAELILKDSPTTKLPEETDFDDATHSSASIMRVVISSRQEVIGILAIHSYRVRAYEQGDLNTLHVFADYCGGALKRIRAEEKLMVLNTQVLNAARRAGMEEVANSVLHNVGNVLNSVNVSSTLMSETLSKSKLGGLENVSALLKEHRKDLAAFLQNDAQGRQIIDYIDVLAQCWSNERSTLTRESGTLNKNIQHIKNIISRQQSLTGLSGFVEPVSITETVEDALTVFSFDLKRIDAVIHRDFHVHQTVVTDRLKLMLVLVNLVSNARDALSECTNQTKQLKVSTQQTESTFEITVTDNGIGIAPENLTRIFSHGFTTKANGHGFGLHSSALAVGDMGGSLSVSSDGPGTGACFTLSLPLKPEVTT